MASAAVAALACFVLGFLLGTTYERVPE